MLYKDILQIPPDFAPCMDAECINLKPDTWLDFYPHETFVEILRQTLAAMEGSGKSIWISGAYGTGKSHAALVLQKLFMDDEERVRRWLDRYADLLGETIPQNLLARRDEGTFAVYDVNADNLDGQLQFLTRLQRSIGNSLRERGLKVPLAGFREQIIERISQDERYFFDKRDQMLARLEFLGPEIGDARALEDALEAKLAQKDYSLVNDIMAVLEARNIYLPLDSATFLQWIDEVLDINNLKRLVFLFDEFSGFLERNRSDLTTFQNLAQAAQQGRFFFAPVTHLSPESFFGRGAETVRKISNRFKFLPLEMPVNIAMKLAGHILRARPGKEEEWERQRDELWLSTEGLVKNYMLEDGDGLETDDFRKILPLHPMSAVALKNLATLVGANQRSLFSFFNDAAFRNYLAVGGLEQANRQYLTVDQLWDYFTTYGDPASEEIIRDTRAEYNRQKSRLDESERRMFIAVLLYSLLEKGQGKAASKLLTASVENLKRAFEGDGVLGPQAQNILDRLAQKRCLSLYREHCYLFQERVESADLEKTIKQWRDKFQAAVLKRSSQALPGQDITTRVTQIFGRSGAASRYDIRVNDANLTPGAYSQADRDRFADKGNQILLQFLFANSEADRVALPEKARRLAASLGGLRALVVIAPEISFCQANADAWEKYLESLAHYANADAATKDAYRDDLQRADETWWSRIQRASLQVLRANANGEPFVDNRSWEMLKNQYLPDYLRDVFPANPDYLCAGNLSALGAAKAFKNWALAGIRQEEFTNAGAWKQVIRAWQDAGVKPDPEWPAANPDHPLVRIREACDKFLQNTSDTGCSLSKLYRKLQKPPFGLIGVPHGAMCLGFALKDWLSPKRGLQWSDGNICGPLDQNILAEMIEAAFRANGENIRHEKQVFRLGPDEKAFVRAIGEIFDETVGKDRGVEGALIVIPPRLERLSGKIPLWMLPWAMRADNIENLEELEAIVESLAELLPLGSGKAQQRANLAREIGAKFRQKPELAGTLKAYLTPVNFERAFGNYVDQTRPELAARARALGDLSGQYLQAIKDRVAGAGSWIWKRKDTDDAIDAVYDGLGCAELIGKISETAFSSFEDAFSRLQTAILRENRTPLEAWEQKYSGLRPIFEALKGPQPGGEALRRFEAALAANEEIIRPIFFDPAYGRQFEYLESLLPDLWPQSLQEQRAAYLSLPEDSARAGTGEFRENFARQLEANARRRNAARLEDIWRERTASANIGEWSRKYLVPPQFALESADIREAEEIAAALGNPDNVATERLERITAFLEKPDSIRDPDAARGAFLEHIAYERHKNIILMAGETLTAWLAENFEPDPEKWLSGAGFQNSLDEFVKNSYQKTVRPRATRKIDGLSGEECRQILIELARTMPDAGFYIMERP